ncbi:I78 family peptidase inhibitor [Kushneria indalinina]|uniref:Peptidase inhibitor I78 family protein n=1 Tax=Kushneria indalinina DSM 14324 TaxID=1122140 RepID=A0A3D9DV46_9GAMM|nr:I78 family peptidase inhibitor [Kushneria indalinina]REC94617.1 peptidase inhibitor I78 family protein [Kushneria indalinina DSM 14324]
MKHSLLTALATTVLLGLGGCAWFGGGGDETASASTDTDAATQHAANDGVGSDEAKKACGANRLDALTDSLLDQDMRQQIVDQSGAQQFRVLATDTIRTMDYHEDRLNIHVNEQGVIQSFDCG